MRSRCLSGHAENVSDSEPPESDPLNDPEVRSCPVAPDARYTPDMLSDVGAVPATGASLDVP